MPKKTVEKTEPYPWGEFLKWRKKSVVWLKQTFGYSDTEIAKGLSIDEMQVHLILKLHNESLLKENNAEKDS